MRKILICESLCDISSQVIQAKGSKSGEVGKVAEESPKRPKLRTEA